MTQIIIPPKRDLYFANREIFLAEDGWSPPSGEQYFFESWDPSKPDLFLGSLVATRDGFLSESVSKKITDEEKRRVDGKAVLGIMEGCYFVPDGFSQNKRFYPKECYIGENGILESKDVKDKLDTRTLFGTFGHEDKDIDEDDIRAGKHALQTYMLWIDEDSGLGRGRSYILNTKDGWNMFCPMKSGSKFKMSTRAKGNYKEGSYKERDGERIPVVDPKSFRLLSIDSVFKPGFNQTSAILKENKTVEVISKQEFDEKMNTQEILKNISKILTEEYSDDLELDKIIKSIPLTEDIKESFSNIKDFDSLRSIFENSKVSVDGEIEYVDFFKNNYVYDSVIIPINHSILTESRINNVIFKNRTFDANPEVSIITESSHPALQTKNAIVLSWKSGDRPDLEKVQNFLESEIFEGEEKLMAKKPGSGKTKDHITSGKKNPDHKFESVQEDSNYWNEEASEDSEDEDSEEDEDDDKKSEAYRKRTDEEDSEEDSEEAEMKKESRKDKYMKMKRQLKEWNTLFGGASPHDVGPKVRSMKENYTRLLQEKKAKKDDMQESLNPKAKEAMKFYEKACKITKNNPSKIFEELKESKAVFSYIKENYGSLPELNKNINKAYKTINLLESKLKASGSSDDKTITEAAGKISGELKGLMSINECAKVIRSYNGNIEKANAEVFNALKNSQVFNESKKETKPDADKKEDKSLNESLDKFTNVNTPRSFSTRTTSLLNSI